MTDPIWQAIQYLIREFGEDNKLVQEAIRRYKEGKQK